MPTPPMPIVFIPGLWMHGTSWTPWVERFAGTGYWPIARPWGGVPATVEETRANPDSAAGYGIAEIADRYARIIQDQGRARPSALPRQPSPASCPTRPRR